MSNRIETLLLRSLLDVLDERDHALRTLAIEAIFAGDCLFADPRGRHVGRRALDEAVVEFQAEFPDHVISPVGGVDALRHSGRLAWAFGPPDDPARITGLDVAVEAAGRTSALYTFLDKEPA